jgi:poly(A) polymerase
MLKELGDRLVLLPEIQCLKNVESLPSKWHTSPTVYLHTLSVMHYSITLYSDEINQLSKMMLIIAALHDIGKPETKIIKDGFVTFPKHADISKVKAKPIIHQLIFDGIITNKQGEDILLVIENHMRPMGCGLEWTPRATRRFIEKADDILDILLRFTDIDIRGTNPSRVPITGLWTKEIQLLRDAIESLNRSS